MIQMKKNPTTSMNRRANPWRQWRAKNPVLVVDSIGTNTISHLKIVKNNEPLFVREVGDDEEYFEYRDASVARDGDFYYVRVVQTDDETAWSSPVWLNV